MTRTAQQIVLIVGDSMALPRSGVAYPETWPFLLESAIGSKCRIVNRSRRGSTTDLLHTEGGGDGREDNPRGADCLEAFQPTFAILQLGIVDCAPRLIARGGVEGRILQRLPKRIRDAYLAFVKRHRKRSADRAYVPLNRFRENIATYMERCRRINTQLVLIEIAPFGCQYKTSNPEADECRLGYNRVLRDVQSRDSELCRIVVPFDEAEAEACVLGDGYHTNPEGHRRIAVRVREAVEGWT